MLRAETIRSQHSDIFTFLQGDLDATATVCHRPEDACRESLVYLSDPKQLESNVCLDAAILIVHRKLLGEIDASLNWHGCLFSVAAMPQAMAALLKYFDNKPERFTQWGERHATAVVQVSARPTKIDLARVRTAGQAKAFSKGCGSASPC